MNYYPNYTNPYYQPQMQRIQQPMQQIQPMVQPMQQPITQMQPIGLQGKSVDSLEVVKAMDIPLDGSISYFPIADGSAIVSKQLQMDGTSKTIIYEPVKAENQEVEEPKFVIPDELNEHIKTINQDNEDLKDGMDSIKEQIELLSSDFKELLKEMKSIKGGKK